MVVLVLRVGVGSHNVILASEGVCSYVSSLGGIVRMLMICFLSSSIVLFVLCESWCIRVFETLSQARRLSCMARLRSVIMSLLDVLARTYNDFPRGLGE